MTIEFYPPQDNLEASTLSDKLEALMEAAEAYKSIVLDAAAKKVAAEPNNKKRSTPRDLTASYNWEEIAKALSEIRQLPEGTPEQKAMKAKYLMRLASIYEALRGAKMAKLEAVRIALINEANQLGGGSQVA